MAYFNKAHTEEELKDQFGKLLLKYDYRNPKKQELIEAIRREYEKKLFEVRRAEADKIEEKPYTRQEYTELILEKKKYINKVLRRIVKRDKVRYVMLKPQLTGDDFAEVYHRFNAAAFTEEDEELCKGYYATCKEIEHATKYLSKSDEECQNLMKQIEIMMGRHVSQALAKYEEMYLDPITMQQLDALSYKAPNSSDKKEASDTELYVILASVIILFFMIMTIVLDEPVIIMFLIPFVIWIALIKLLDVVMSRVPKEK